MKCTTCGHDICDPCWRARSEILRERDELQEEARLLRAVLKEAQLVAALKYEVVHKGSGPPSDYDPDIYQLERVTASGWHRFVRAVQGASK